MSAENMNGALDWDSEISNDGASFTTLPEGDYNFEVTDFERGRFPGSAKISPCPKAVLTLRVKGEEGIANFHTDLILASNMEWQISAFFRSIGQKKKGQAFRPDWTKVVGQKGRAHLKVKDYVKDGETRSINEVDYYIDYDEKNFPPDGDTDGDGFMTIPEGAAEELPFN